MTTTFLNAATATTSAGSTQLIFSALVGIALIVLLVTQLKLHPFLSLTIGSIAVGALAGMQLKDALVSFGAGVGSTVASVGTLIALGALIGLPMFFEIGLVLLMPVIVLASRRAQLPLMRVASRHWPGCR
jgi:GntP family gluconate:H+ symporter